MRPDFEECRAERFQILGALRLFNSAKPRRLIVGLRQSVLGNYRETRHIDFDNEALLTITER